MVIGEVYTFTVEAKSDKVTFIWLSFTDVRAKRNGKVGEHLDCKTMGNVCQVTERVTRICKKANNCCLWRQLNPNHYWGVWTMRWNFAPEVIWNVPDKKIPTMSFLWTMVSYRNWRPLLSHSYSYVSWILTDGVLLFWGWDWAISKKRRRRKRKRASAFCQLATVFDFKKILAHVLAHQKNQAQPKSDKNILCPRKLPNPTPSKK